MWNRRLHQTDQPKGSKRRGVTKRRKTEEEEKEETFGAILRNDMVYVYLGGTLPLKKCRRIRLICFQGYACNFALTPCGNVLCNWLHVQLASLGPQHGVLMGLVDARIALERNQRLNSVS